MDNDAADRATLLGAEVHSHDHVPHLRPEAVRRVASYYKEIGWSGPFDPSRMHCRVPPDASSTGLGDETLTCSFRLPFSSTYRIPA